MTYPIHPAANVFPLMADDDLLKLADDIKRNGLIHPIELMGNMVIDGRNRLRACELAGIAPRYVEVKVADPIRYVTAANIHRRHLSTAQRAAIAAELANLGDGEKKRTESSGVQFCTPPIDVADIHGGDPVEIPAVSLADAAELLNVSRRSVTSAKATMKSDPAAHEAIKRGEKPLPPQNPRKAPAVQTPSNSEDADMGKQFRYLVAQDAYFEATGIRIGYTFIRENLGPEIKAALLWANDSDARKPLTDAQAADIRRVVFAYAERTGKMRKAPEQAPEPAQETQYQKELARRMRVLEAQMEERAKVYINELLKTYADEYAKYKAFNDSYRGVMTEEEYRLLLSVLHPDRCPPERASQFSRAFHLIKSKEEILCGAKENDNPKTLPSTLEEFLARRKMN